MFEQIVSVEAWRGALSPSNRCAPIHVDVSFLGAKLGQEPESKVRFDVFLKRAEILIYIPETDPVKVVQSSVARERPLAGQRSAQVSTQRGYGVSGAAGISTSGAAPISARLEASGRASKEHKADLELAGAAREFNSRQYTSDGHYCWEVTPAASDRLIGKVWDAVQEPRLSIKFHGKIGDMIGLGCRVFVRCRREDIEITNVTVKEKTRKSLIDRFKANREAAAAAYIRAALGSRDLHVLDFDEKYANILMADVLIDEEVI